MNRLLPAALVAAIFVSTAADASTFAPVIKKCAVGGEKFRFLEQMSSTSFGQLPDGMTVGTGPNPPTLPQCPKNGLVMYRDFDAATTKALASIIATPEYQSLRATETPYYLAYWLARTLGDETPAWLLLAAGWEAKNEDSAGPRARRYADEFIAVVAAMPVSDTSFDSIALRARAANALREAGKFAEAEALRASIVIAPNAGGVGSDAADNRQGWASFLTQVAAPIARGDAARAPIDMVGTREAAFRCIAPLLKSDATAVPVPSLTTFEVGYCARPDIAAAVATLKDQLGDRLVQ